MVKKLYKNNEYFITSFSLNAVEDKFMRDNGISPTHIMKQHIADMMKVRDATQKEIDALTKEVRTLKILWQLVREKHNSDDWSLNLLNEAQIQYTKNLQEGLYD